MSFRVDAHHHLWDLTITAQPWLSASMSKLNRSFLTADLAAAVDGRLNKTVIVQTASGEAETLWMLEQANRFELIGAVVGWVDLTAGNVGERLAALKSSPNGRWLAGIRHQVHDEPDPNWLLRPDVQRGLRAVGAAGLVYDFLLRPEHLVAALVTAHRLDSVSFCIDHIGKPRISSGDLGLWRFDMGRLASLPNVTCKLSGLVTEAAWESWTVDDLRPFADVVMNAFGPRRVMFGSDWPVCLLAASYSDVLESTYTLLDGYTDSERDDVLGGTASRVYEITNLDRRSPEQVSWNVSGCESGPVLP